MERAVSKVLAGCSGMRFRDDEGAVNYLMPNWIKFVEDDLHDGRKTKVWKVLAIDGDLPLGRVAWYAPWRRYAFYPWVDSSRMLIFEWECMRKIADFCEQATKDRKLERQEERQHGRGVLRDHQV